MLQLLVALPGVNEIEDPITVVGAEHFSVVGETDLIEAKIERDLTDLGSTAPSVARVLIVEMVVDTHVTSSG